MLIFTFLIVLVIDYINSKPLFASTPIQIINASYDNYGQAHYMNISTMSVDNDIISLHEDCNWGIPWNAFWGGVVNETLFPPRWKQHLRDTVDLVLTTYSNKPVFISFNTLGGGTPGRSCPSRNVTYNNGQESFTGCTGCYDFNETNNNQALYVKKAYIQYVLYFINYFISSGVTIQYINHCTECNFYIEGNICSIDQWNSVKLFANNIYDNVKSRWPNIIMIPSFQVESFRGQLNPNQECYNTSNVTKCVDNSWQLIQGLKYDIFGLSSYPYTPAYIANNDVFMNSNYLDIILNKLPNNTQCGIAETGFVTSDIIFNYNENNPNCIYQYYSNVSRAMDWMNYIGTQIATKYNLKLFTWFSNSNFLPKSFALECPCNQTNDVLGNQYFCSDYWDTINGTYFKSVFAKVFATMALRSYSNQPKPGLYDLWMQLQK